MELASGDADARDYGGQFGHNFRRKEDTLSRRQQEKGKQSVQVSVIQIFYSVVTVHSSSANSLISQ